MQQYMRYVPHDGMNVCSVVSHVVHLSAIVSECCRAPLSTLHLYVKEDVEVSCEVLRCSCP